MNIGASIVGGLVGGTAMIALLYLGIWMLPRQMKMNLLLLIGTMVAPLGATAYAIGLMAHAMMSVTFGLVHGGLMDAVGVTSTGQGAAYGALFGLGHALVVGVILGMMPMLHPRMRSTQGQLVPALAGGSAPRGEELLDPPGFFGLNYPMPTVMGFFMLHVMFGVIVGTFYGASA
jgi:hypothetical protein